MNGRRRHRIWAWLVLFVAIGAVLGHVCVLPHHVHADEAAASTDGHAGHDETDDHALHDASCEALRSGPAQVTLRSMTSSTVAAELPHLARKVARLDAPVLRTEPPPLFLLHAALLI